ncbi:MAG: 50S ribosomal protein L13 [Planctomycetes bacterium]|nr:50S ribosomal protein L13 [Planctomycetota bacterium]
MKTTHVTAQTAEERWLLYDASEHVLGRMASQIAKALMGKDRPSYQPEDLTGAFVVVINAEKPVLTGNKRQEKSYVHYTGYPGGQKFVSIDGVLTNRPTDVVRLAVRRMLPKSKLGMQMLTRLKIYSGAEHPHGAQNPTKVASTHKKPK